MATYTILTNHDRWRGIAIDGEIQYQGHEVTPQQALKIAQSGPPIDEVERITARAADGHRPASWPGTIKGIREDEAWKVIE